MPELSGRDPQLRRIDHARASAAHAFRGRTVDNVIAVMEANHPHPTTRKSCHVGISHARYRVELVTDNAKALREQLETVTGERVSALEGTGAEAERPPAREKVADRGRQEVPGISPQTEDRTGMATRRWRRSRNGSSTTSSCEDPSRRGSEVRRPAERGNSITTFPGSIVESSGGDNRIVTKSLPECIE